MPRSVTIIAITGLAACLVMSMIMHYFLKTQQESTRNPVAQEVQELFGGRLELGTSLQYEDRDGLRVAVLTVTPILGLSKGRLAKDLGQYTWRRLVGEDRPDKLEVRCLDTLGGEADVFPIAAPYMRRSSPSLDPKPGPKPGAKPGKDPRAPGR